MLHDITYRQQQLKQTMATHRKIKMKMVTPLPINNYTWVRAWWQTQWCVKILVCFLGSQTLLHETIFPLPKEYYHYPGNCIYFFTSTYTISVGFQRTCPCLRSCISTPVHTFHTANLLIRHNCVSQLTCMIPIWPYAMLMSLLLASLSLLASLGFLSIILLSAFS